MNATTCIKKSVLILSHLKEYIKIPIGVSNRHIHLSQEDYDLLFPNEEIVILKELTQPGFYAAKQVVTVEGPRGKISNVRLLGPLRSKTQVELSKTDSRMLGINPPVRLSGDLDDAVEITVSTTHGSIKRNAAILAKRHIHMSERDAEVLGFKKGDSVQVLIETNDRKTIFDDVEIRPQKGTVLELHLDTDEANACDVQKDTVARFI